MTKEKSIILWKYLSQMNEEDFFGMFIWYYRGFPNDKKIQNDFLKKLIENKWLYDKSGNVYCPSEIFEDELADEYERNEILVKVLKIKKLKNGMSYEEYMEIVRLNNMDENAQKQFLNEEYEDEIIEVDAEKVYSNFNNEILKLTLNDDDYEQENDKDEKSLIGLWGERFVFNSFIKKYEDEGAVISLKEDKDCYMTYNEGNTIKISLMDRDGICNEGYDISITVNNEIYEYIEVKSKSKTSSKPFSISNSQWKMATALFGENCGEKYSLCFVINAGTKDAEIIYNNNPVKRWIDGEIRIRKIGVK